jgi:hypothetical protein
MATLRTAAILMAAAVALSGSAQAGWKNPKSIRMKVHEQGKFVSSKDYTVYRAGKQLRIEGEFSVYGALAKAPHVEIHSETGSFLYVPSLNAALHLVQAVGTDRAAVTNASDVDKRLFSAPKSLLEKELKKPARFEGEEQVAGRTCYILATANPRSTIHQERQWIDTTYGTVLKLQEIEAGEVVFERLVTEVAFNEPVDPALFAVPEEATVVTGLLSTQALENVRSLDDQQAFVTELKAMVGAERKDDRRLAWVSTLTPPAGMMHATTTYRPPLVARQPGTGTQQGPGGRGEGPGGIRPPGLGGRGGTVWMSDTGDGEHRVAIVTTGSGEAVAEGEMTFSISVAGDQGEPQIMIGTGDGQTMQIQRLELSVEDLARLRELRPGGEEWLNRLRDLTRSQGGRMAAKEGMFISEFINPETGHSLVFYQAEGADPTSVIGSKSLLGEAEAVTEDDFLGTYYRASAPYERCVLAWQHDSTWYALSATGLSRKELVTIAKGVRRL